MCGAAYCAECNPAGQKRVTCEYCGEETIIALADDWKIIGNDAVCPDCIAELERAAEDDSENA